MKKNFKVGDFVVVPRLLGRSAFIKVAIVHEMRDGKVYKIILEDSYNCKPSIVKCPERILQYTSSFLSEHKRNRLIKGIQNEK